MNRKTSLAAIGILTLLVASTSAIAKEFSYDYIQAGIGTSNYKAYDREYYVAISKPIKKDVAIVGTIHYLYGDWNDPGEYEEQRVNAYALEGVYHKPVASDTDMLASVKYSHSNYKLNCTPTTGVCGTYSDATPSFDHYGLKVGFAHKIQDDVEVEIQYSLTSTKWTSSTATSRQASASLMQEVFDKTPIGVEYAWGLSGSGIDHYGLFIRKIF